MPIKSKKINLLVTSDLVSDQRVHRTALSLHEMGALVTVYGREKKSSPPIDPVPYTRKRIGVLPEKGPLFYALFNLKIFFVLLFKPVDIVYANDLDTLPAATLIANIKKAKLVYDSHELYTEVPELASRLWIKKIWTLIEKKLSSHINLCITVNQSIADELKLRYNLQPIVVRNIATANYATDNSSGYHLRKALLIPDQDHILLYQGSGINIQRGAEEALLMMKYLYNCTLVFIGGGDVFPILKNMASANNLNHKVKFLDRLPFSQLQQITKQADIGLCLTLPIGLNYQLSLPNKLFDYIHSELPIVASNLPEITRLVNQYRLGIVLENHHPEQMAKAISKLLEQPGQIATYKINCNTAAKVLNWENEKKILCEAVQHLAG
jgi:glycosyltransferase involved in cell wall biosynthesis